MNIFFIALLPAIASAGNPLSTDPADASLRACPS
jgi:hypothetical protein